MERKYLVCLLLATVLTVARAEDKTAAGDEIRTEASQMDFDEKTQWLTATGNVRIEYQDAVLTADAVRIQRPTKDFEAAGNVKLQRGDFTWETEHISGNLDTQTFVQDKHTAHLGIWTFQGQKATARKDGIVLLEDVRMSSCSDWWLRAQTVEFDRNNGDFIARNVRWQPFGMTAFWLPFVTGNTNEMARPMGLSAGYDGDFGFTVGFAREFRLGSDWRVTPLVDYRTKRGFGLGTEVRLNAPDVTSKWLLYGLHDDDPPSDQTIAGTDYNDRFRTEEDRFRISGYHRQDFGDNWTLRLREEVASDPWVREEFWRRDWRRDPQPPTYAAVEGDYERFQMGAFWRPRVNDFETVVARSPELRLSMPRQQVFDTPIYYENRNSAARLEMDWRDYDLPRPGWADPADYETTRLDSLHVITAPTVWDDFSIVPRAAVRATWYEDTSRRRVTDAMLGNNFKLDDVYGEPTGTGNGVGYDDLGGDRLRWAYETGVEVSTTFYRTWPHARQPGLDVDGLRHVVEPYANYTYIPAVNEPKERLYYFDDVDRIDEANFVRVGLRQRLQTRRDGRLHTLARLENYLDLHVDATDHGPTMGDFGHSLDLALNPALAGWARALIDSDQWRWNVLDTGVRFGREDSTNLSLNYLYRNNYTSRYSYSMASDLTRVFHDYLIQTDYAHTHDLGIAATVPINDLTKFRAQWYIDLDRGELGVQSYELLRRFRCWDVTLSVQQDVDVWGAYVTVAMRDLPSVSFSGGL